MAGRGLGLYDKRDYLPRSLDLNPARPASPKSPNHPQFLLPLLLFAYALGEFALLLCTPFVYAIVLLLAAVVVTVAVVPSANAGIEIHRANTVTISIPNSFFINLLPP